ncbi:MAG: hypothetical protein ACK4V2_03940 [Pseudomonadota bacterium]|nr:hypothetical protein [Alphaproteobacteria bacterium]
MRVILLFAAIFFNVLQATDVEYSQLRAHLTARFKTETYKAIASDFDADPRTVSNFVNGTGKSPKILKKAKDKYPTIFQQQAVVHHAVPAPQAPLVLNQQPIIKEEPAGTPVVKQEIAPALPSQYLSLPDLGAGSKYVISMVPMNSSGDSYHILAYLILSLSHGKKVPDILLTYDGADEIRELESKMNAFTQVQRTLHFAQVLGYGGYFKTAFIDTGNCQRENNRQHKLEEYLSATAYTHYIDQKALTTIIAEHFRTFGKDNTTQRLREGFNKYSAQHLSKAACKQLVKKARDEIGRIGANPNPLIVMHVRYSSKANEKQNMEDGVIGKLSNYVKSKGYNVWFVFTDGRKQKAFKSLGNDRTDPFPFYQGNEDNGKYFHLQLLLNLRTLPNLRGIIGNTSGTLDLAGFLGHNVYNLHNVQQAFDYQSCRILIQSSFLTVERLNFDSLENALRTPQRKLGEFSDAIAQAQLPLLSGWITGAVPQAVGLKTVTTVNSYQAGYWELFFVKKLFGNLLDPLQSLLSTVNYLQAINPTIKIEI